MAFIQVRLKELAPKQIDKIVFIESSDLPQPVIPEPVVSVAWTDITGKPSAFPPADHTHPDLEALIWFSSP